MSSRSFVLVCVHARPVPQVNRLFGGIMICKLENVSRSSAAIYKK